MDLNGDGHDDLISGEYSPGRVSVWYGSATGFGARQVLPEALYDGAGRQAAEADMGEWMATASFVDWNGDGLLDLLVGDTAARVRVALNEGTPTDPRFGPREPLMVGDEPMVAAGKSDPLACDWDGDGRLDILCGCEAGDVLFFRRRVDGGFDPAVSAISGAARPEMTYAAVRAQCKAEGIEFGYRTRIGVGDWNGDGRLDLLVGDCERPPGSAKTTGWLRVLLREPEAADRR